MRSVCSPIMLCILEVLEGAAYSCSCSVALVVPYLSMLAVQQALNTSIVLHVVRL